VQRGRALEDRLAANLVNPVASPDSLRQGDVVAALAGLREKDREALLLVAWEGLSTAEGAQVLGAIP
jgi:RNA polymerase sigma-70 factor (ECF subfamily)